MKEAGRARCGLTCGVGGIAFDDIELAQAVGVVALAFTLFDGGL